MADESPEKAIKRSVSIPPDLLDDAQCRADAFHGGNLSRYIQSLLKADLSGELSHDKDLSGAIALKRFGEIQPGNYRTRLMEAAANGIPFARVVDNLTGGDPELMVLARRAYDFLQNSHPAMNILMEIRDRLDRAGDLSLDAELRGRHELNEAPAPDPYPKTKREKKVHARPAAIVPLGRPSPAPATGS